MKLEKFAWWSDRTVVFGFCALIYFAPISTALVESFSGLVMAAFLAWRVATAIPVHPPRAGWWAFLRQVLRPPDCFLNRILALFFAWNVVSVLFSEYRLLGVESLVGKTFQGLAMLLIFVDRMHTPRRWVTFAAVFFVSAILITVNGFWQYAFGHGFIHGYELVANRIVSSFKHPNDLGSYLLLVVFVLMALLLSGRTKREDDAPGVSRMLAPGWRVAWGALLTAVMGVLGLTFSRGAWLGFLIGLIFFMSYRRRAGAVLLPLLVLFVLVFHPRLIAVRNVSIISDSFNYDRVATIESTVGVPEGEPLSGGDFLRAQLAVFREFGGMGRKGYWTEAVHIIKDFPVFGAGPNSYSQVAPDYKVNWGGYPHNCYLHMAAEIGVPGLLMFLFMLGQFFRRAHRRIRQNDATAVLLLGLSTGLVAFLVHSFVDTNMYSVKLGVLMWVMLGFGVAVCQYSAPPATVSR